MKTNPVKDELRLTDEIEIDEDDALAGQSDAVPDADPVPEAPPAPMPRARAHAPSAARPRVSPAPSADAGSEAAPRAASEPSPHAAQAAPASRTERRAAPSSRAAEKKAAAAPAAKKPARRPAEKAPPAAADEKPVKPAEAPAARPRSVSDVTAAWRDDAGLNVPFWRTTPVLIIAVLVILALLFGVIALCLRGPGGADDPSDTIGQDEPGSGVSDVGTHPFADGAEGNVLIPFAAQTTVINNKRLSSERAALVDVSAGRVVASYHADERMYPASMTKVMTLIVVAENLPEESSLKDKLTVSQSVYDAMNAAGSSGMHLEVGEQLTVEDMLYLLMLKSDGIAANELARYIAGSESAFVTLMNMKAADMGLENTHFTNVTGLHDDNHYSTCRDMASIMVYAMNMSLCRKIMTTESREASSFCTAGENKGKTIPYHVYNNLLVTMLGEQYRSYRPAKLTVKAGKTGYDGKDSGYCLASFAESPDGKVYVCVTSRSASYLDCIKDYITIYNDYAG